MGDKMEVLTGNNYKKFRLNWYVKAWDGLEPISKTFRLLVHEGLEAIGVLSASREGEVGSKPMYKFSYELTWIDFQPPLLYKLSYHLSRNDRPLWQDSKGHSTFVSQRDVPPRETKTSTGAAKGSLSAFLDIEFNMNELKTFPKHLVAVSELPMKLLSEKLLTDFVIACGEDTFDCHKSILAARSEYFRSMLTGQFREANEGKVEIKGIDSSVMKHVITFIYSNNVSDDVVTWSLFEAAKMYSLPDLEKLCLDSLGRKLAVSTCCEMLQLTFKHDLDELFDRATHFFRRNKAEVTETTDWQTVAENTKLITRIVLSLR